jgi:5-methylcytosine-specific restriction endonuclease McrA
MLEATARKLWDEIRRRVYYRDEGTCRVCGRLVFLSKRQPLLVAHVHHIIYRSAGGPDELWNLITICLWCHEDEHVTRKISISGTSDNLTIERH